MACSRRLIVVAGLAPFLLSCVTETTPARQLSLLEAIEIAHEAGFACPDQLLTAVAVAVSESSLLTGARNDHPEYSPEDHDRGVWQISSYWWPQYSNDDMSDPWRNAQAAYEISQGGTDFTPWDTYDRGVAQRHFDEAFDGWPALRPVIREYCSRAA